MGEKATEKPQNSTDSPELIHVSAIHHEAATILPLYEMYRLVVSPGTTPPPVSYREQPPLYETTQTLLSALLFAQDSEGNPPERFEDLLLPNIHKLRRLGDIDKHRELLIQLKIIFTEELSHKGKEIIPIDPPTHLKQGDVVNGVVIVTNKNDEPVPFENFLVVLEGMVGLEGKTVKFLNQVDLFALWNDGYLDRDVESISEYNLCPLVISVDEFDGTQTFLPASKVLMPNESYKKFFLFTLPEVLIYCECDLWHVAHMQLPSSLGRSKLAHGYPYRNDFAFPDASVTYGVHCLIICRALEVDMRKEEEPDEYILVAEKYSFLNVYAGTYEPYLSNRATLDRQASLMYSNLIAEVEDIIDQNREGWTEVPIAQRLQSTEQVETLAESASNEQQRPQLVSTPSHIETNRLKQTYKGYKDGPASKESIYEVFMQYRKKSLWGLKVIGLSALSVPRETVVVHTANYRGSGKFNISLQLDHIWSEGITYPNPPDFKIVNAEFTVLTTKAKSNPLQLLLTHDNVFQNKPTYDSIEYLTIHRFQKYAIKLGKIMKSKGVDALGPDSKRIVAQVKLLANLGRLAVPLTFKQCKIKPHNDKANNFCTLSEIPWESEQLGSQTKYSKKFDLELDIADLRHAEFGKNFVLCPSFQNCFIGRMYYLTVVIRCPNGDKLLIKVPIVLERVIE